MRNVGSAPFVYKSNKQKLQTYEDLGARKGAFFDDIQIVAIVALSDDILASFKADFLHRAKDYLELLWV